MALEIFKIENVFYIESKGVVVTGTLKNEEIKVGDIIKISDSQNNFTSVKILGILQFKKSIEKATKNMKVGLVISKKYKNKIKSGMMIIKENLVNGENNMKELYKTIVKEVVKDSLKHLSESANNNVREVVRVFYENPDLIYEYLEQNNVFDVLDESDVELVLDVLEEKVSFLKKLGRKVKSWNRKRKVKKAVSTAGKVVSKASKGVYNFAKKSGSETAKNYKQLSKTKKAGVVAGSAALATGIGVGIKKYKDKKKK